MAIVIADSHDFAALDQISQVIKSWLPAHTRWSSGGHLLRMKMSAKLRDHDQTTLIASRRSVTS